MTNLQREQNPDVNSYNPDISPAENPEPSSDKNDGAKDRDVIPVPPDAQPGAAPVEEPPGSEGVPVGDVDDSPKKIAQN